MKVLVENENVIVFSAVLKGIQLYHFYYPETGDVTVSLSGLHELLGYNSVDEMLSCDAFWDMVIEMMQKNNAGGDFPLKQGELTLFRKKFKEKNLKKDSDFV